jgi:predicted Zn finger-like uncharacterized protein
MVITVQCPSCATTFPVDPKKVPVGGVNARCSTCSDVFRVARPEEGMAASGSLPAPVPVPQPASSPPAAPTEALRVETPLEHAGSHAGPAGPSPSDTGVPSARDAAVDDWVFETESDLDPATFDIAPMGAVEETNVSDEGRSSDRFSEPMTSSPMTAPPMEEASGEGELEARVEAEPEMHSTLLDVPAPPAPPPPTPEPPKPTGAFTFGKRDPADKARRLARVLVSDMIMYNPERHERALANGTLKEDFADEIAKSWKEYVEQVGADMARGNSFWTEALNDVLAKGERIF